MVPSRRDRLSRAARRSTRLEGRGGRRRRAARARRGAPARRAVRPDREQRDLRAARRSARVLEVLRRSARAGAGSRSGGSARSRRPPWTASPPASASTATSRCRARSRCGPSPARRLRRALRRARLAGAGLQPLPRGHAGERLPARARRRERRHAAAVPDGLADRRSPRAGRLGRGRHGRAGQRFEQDGLLDRVRDRRARGAPGARRPDLGGQPGVHRRPRLLRPRARLRRGRTRSATATSSSSTWPARRTLRRAVHEHAQTRSARRGSSARPTGSRRRSAPIRCPAPTPEVFSAAAYIERRAGSWGRASSSAASGARGRASPTASQLLEIEAATGAEALGRTYDALLAGTADPRKGTSSPSDVRRSRCRAAGPRRRGRRARGRPLRPAGRRAARRRRRRAAPRRAPRAAPARAGCGRPRRR